MEEGRVEFDRYFGFLRRVGFDLESFNYEPEAFGNFVAVYRREDVALRVVRDRSEVFVDAAKAGSAWQDKETLLESSGIPRSRHEIVDGLWAGYEIETQASDLRKNFEVLLQALSATTASG